MSPFPRTTDHNKNGRTEFDHEEASGNDHSSSLTISQLFLRLLIVTNARPVPRFLVLSNGTLGRLSA